VDRLIEVLDDRQVLLVLDSWEQVLPAVRLLGDLLAACPCVAVLATSREVLRLAGEHVFAVAPLALPAAAGPGSSAEAAGQSAAVQLFVARACAAQAGFALTADNAAAVATICRLLDGLPLAIELAAACVRVLPPAQLCQRLADRFGLLVGGDPAGAARHRTLAAAVAWSYDLLTPSEQLVFGRLSVFAGDFTLAAAEAVCAGGAIAPEHVLGLLTQLVEKSLLVAGRRTMQGAANGSAGASTAANAGEGTQQGRRGRPEHRRAVRRPATETGATAAADATATAGPGTAPAGRGDAWFHLLETLRAFAHARLEAAGEAATVRAQHAHYYLGLAAAGVPRAEAADPVWLDHLEDEHDNLRATLAHLASHTGAGTAAQPAAAHALRLARALVPFWAVRGHVSEGRDWLQRLLALPGTDGARVRADALLAAAALAWTQGDYTAEQRLAQEGLACLRACGDTLEEGQALGVLARAAYNRGDLTGAGALADQALALQRGLSWPAPFLPLLIRGHVARDRATTRPHAPCSRRTWRARRRPAIGAAWGSCSPAWDG
jgi:predicted ATPase